MKQTELDFKIFFSICGKKLLIYKKVFYVKNYLFNKIMIKIIEKYKISVKKNRNYKIKIYLTMKWNKFLLIFIKIIKKILKKYKNQ